MTNLSRSSATRRSRSETCEALPDHGEFVSRLPPSSAAQQGRSPASTSRSVYERASLIETVMPCPERHIVPNAILRRHELTRRAERISFGTAESCGCECKCNRLHRCHWGEGHSDQHSSASARLASGISTVAVAAALCVASQPTHRTEYGAMQGHVDGAKLGTQVVAVDTIPAQRSVGTINAAGNYVILGLRPSTYTVTAAGQTTQTTDLQVGQTVTDRFRPATAATPWRGRQHRRHRPAPGQPVQRADRCNQHHARANREPPPEPAQLPELRAPRARRAGRARAQRADPGRRSRRLNVNVLLDGMSFKNPINHGGVFGQNFGLGNPFPQIAIQEYQVQTQNFGAETGQAGSALITAITKTGGDEFHGSAFIEFQPKAFITEPYLRQEGPFDPIKKCQKSDYDRKQFGGEFGGPIVPARLPSTSAAKERSKSCPVASDRRT